MANFVFWLLVVCLYEQAESNIQVVQKGDMTFADPHHPWCEYESCYNNEQCTSSPAQKNPNFAHKTNAIFPCSCGNYCLLYGDCCFDYFQVCHGIDISEAANNLSSMVMSLGNMTSKKAVEDQMQMLLHKECRKMNSDQYWFVTHCPQNVNLSKTDIDMCESNNQTVLGKIPVSLRENPTITFWNYHCAECHGLKRNDVRFWHTTASCEGNNDALSYTDAQQLILHGICKMIAQPNSNDKPRRCMDTFQKKPTLPLPTELPRSTVISNKTESEKLCPLYLYPVQDPGNNTYRNSHCAYLINGPIFNNFPFRCAWKYAQSLAVTAVPTGSPVLTALVSGTTGFPATTPVSSVGRFSIMFNFGETGMTLHVGGKVLRVETVHCAMEDEVFLPYSERCVKLHCDDEDRRPVNGTCRLKKKFVINGTGQPYPEGTTSFVVSLQVRGKKSVIKNVMRRQLSLSLRTLFNTSILNLPDSKHNVNVKKVTKFTVKNNFTCCHREMTAYGYNILIHSTVPASEFVGQLLDTYRFLSGNMTRYNLSVTYLRLKNFKTPNMHIEYTVSDYNENINSNNSICPNERIQKLFKNVETVLDENEVLYAKLNISYFKLDNIIFQQNVEDTPFLHDETDVLVCLPDHTNNTFHCPDGFILVEPPDFRFENDSLIYVPQNLRLSPDKYRRTDNGADICSTFTRDGKKDHVVFFDYNDIQDILTIVTSSVSMSSLFVVLLVYSSLPELRNVPGKIVMSLSATFLLAQGLQLLITVPAGWLCTAVASLVHTTWLSSFIWMTMLSVDLTRSLRSMSPMVGVHRSSKVFFLYTGLAWFLPILFVAICVLVDHFSVWGVVIGYGSDHLCWISNPTASLYIFGLPVGLTLITNGICFVLTSVSIHKTSFDITIKTKSGKNDTTRLGIYIRLSLIMGLSWSFCFAAAFSQIELLWYFQIILDGLQGFYIFVCFVCKSRVRKMLKDKFHLHLKKGLMKDTFTTSTNNNKGVCEATVNKKSF